MGHHRHWVDKVNPLSWMHSNLGTNQYQIHLMAGAWGNWMSNTHDSQARLGPRSNMDLSRPTWDLGNTLRTLEGLGLWTSWPS